jgi:deoxyribodipyrimidine photolyase
MQTMHPRGYYKMAVDYRYYLVHRVVWLYCYGEWPDEIDHINGVPTDNRLCNLRSVNHSQNMKNRKLSVTNTSGYKGVSRFRDKWKAQIRSDGSTVYLGLFDKPEDAHAAYCKASDKLHGLYARTA